ncbi:MAG: SCO family protein [Nevskia sp.]
MSNPSLRWGLLAALAVAIGLVAGMLLLRPAIREIASGTLLSTPRPVPEFALADTDGKPYTKADLAGHWTLIFPGFTFCPDVCPTTLATLKAVHDRLGAAAADVQVVLLSIDPARDTPEKLGAYVHAFSRDFRGVTGGNEELEKLGASLGFVYAKVTGATPETYTMDHSVQMILIGPDARLRGYFSPPYKIDALVADLRALTASTAHRS